MPLAADRIEHLQQECRQQLLWRDRWTPVFRVHPRKPRRQPLQRLVHHPPHRAQRMIRCDPLLGCPIAKDPALLLVLASHETKTFTIVSWCQLTRIFPQPASLVARRPFHGPFLINFTFTGYFRVGARSWGRADGSLKSGLRHASRSFEHWVQIGTPFEKR